MTNQRKGKEKEASGLLGTLKRKLVALAAVLVPLLAVVNELSDLCPIFRRAEVTPAERIQRCLDATVVHSGETVLLSRWRDTEFHLSGTNDCERELNTHVAFKPKIWTVTIESPNPGCSELNKPDCWVEQTLGPGQVDVKITPPRLTLLNALDDETEVEINWILYASEGIKVRSGGNAVRVRDDLSQSDQGALIRAAR